MTGTIFIIVPIYNAEKYLKECLESIQEQSVSGFTCVMVNDGSTDNSLTICNEFSKDSRFVLLSQENKGVAAARNAGLSYVLSHATENDFLTFIDADDFVRDSYLENFSKALKEFDEADILFCGWNQLRNGETISHKLEKSESVVYGDFREDFECLDSFLQTLWGNFYSIKILQERKICFDEKLHISEDIQFNFTYAPFVKKYVFINCCLYNYRELQNSLSHTNLETDERISMRFANLERRIKFMTECDIKNKDFVIAKHISNITTGTIFNPRYKRLYELVKYAEPKYGRTKGQRRVIFCLKHKILWAYRMYLSLKNILTC